jgi:hypothetical protein
MLSFMLSSWEAWPCWWAGEPPPHPTSKKRAASPTTHRSIGIPLMRRRYHRSGSYGSYELPRIPIPRTPLNRGEEGGPGQLSRHLYPPSPAVRSACSTHLPRPRSPHRRRGQRSSQGRGGYSDASSAAISSKTIWPPLSPTLASLSSVAEAAIARSFSGRYACKAPQP